MKQLICTILIFVTVAACTNKATGNRFSANALGTTDETQTQIVIYRPNTFVGSANWDVPLLHLDGKTLTPMRINGYVVLPVDPGEHHLKTTEVLFGSDTGRIRGEIRLGLKQGTKVYLQYAESITSVVPIPSYQSVALVVSGAYSFQPVPPDVALKELAGTNRLAVSSN